MANTKQAQKYIRQTVTRTERSRAVRSRLRTLAKKLNAVAEQPEEAKKIAIEYTSVLDKACKRNIIHANTANRHKAAISKYIFTAA
ncbi:30S ribosomal protein S20 [Cerasicoccus arenae]|uniref:Small ribosomal subunit protein bS20 n=1 Tax=Cerasicoccus arenae TaxID=424488 RepID=A0A8J3DFY4_9BACT|nr:30S ribosomal protein S20 [Cerasicoccus arenae]MBK1859312.1 30S ribosomal protein S20 [Cerasicoccus arenae]GHB94232.1 30S ribosomal protein S20 [Cerasicoccus arenae]